MRFDNLRSVQNTNIHQDDDGIRPSELLSIADVISFFKHFWPFIASASIACAILGLLYVLTATPTYTATAQLLIETNQASGPTIMTPEAVVSLDTPQIESEIAVLNSEQIVGRVAKTLLKGDAKADAADKTSPPPTASTNERGWLSRLLFGALPPPTPAQEAEKLRQIELTIQSNLGVKRVGLSYVLELSYRDPDPKKAAEIVNTLGDAYVQDKIDGRASAARRNSLWLEARIEEIRRLMNEAAIDVQEFKARRDYRLADRPTSSDSNLGLDFLPKPTSPASPATGDGASKAAPKDNQPVTTPQEAPTLEELDSRALTYQKIYESYLRAYTDTVQRQSYPSTSARLITRAQPPKRKSSPKGTLTLLGSLIFGGILGAGAALAMSVLNERVRSSNQLMRHIGAPLLGEIDDTRWRSRLPIVGKHLGRRQRRKRNALIVVSHPQSPDARQLVKTAAAINDAANARGAVAIGIFGISKAIDDAAVCSNVALLNARAGKRTLLIETEPGRTNLAASLVGDLQFDLKDVIEGRAEPEAAIVQYDIEPALSLLLVDKTEAAGFWTLQRVAKLSELIKSLSGSYENIFVHLPSGSDTEVVTKAVEGVVIVAEIWQTSLAELEDVASRMRIVGQPPLGVVSAKFS
ncbi:Wzz/FepE/Etk N-terminal domain-containing protein [Hyphomicrobium sp. 802]|uniref:exopolysaccharide transport family protein n=1 Tax=Hyphomicrobium sp. 802 TaxID=1112272 RepID=UPI00045E78BB|nr:Wzz/FepE/Etk N-terminal domain-containing protein [Hyphomicrobium sp. 802]